MNTRCTICHAVVQSGRLERCPECGARSNFLEPTTESPRHAKGEVGDSVRVWEFSPSGPVLRRLR